MYEWEKSTEHFALWAYVSTQLLNLLTQLRDKQFQKFNSFRLVLFFHARVYAECEMG